MSDKSVLTDEQLIEIYNRRPDGWTAGLLHRLRAVADAAVQAARAQAWTAAGGDYDRAIHHNPDARAWADFFMATFPNCGADRDTMVGWFANAMMAMHDSKSAADRAARAEPVELVLIPHDATAEAEASALKAWPGARVVRSAAPSMLYTAPPAASVVPNEEGKHCGDPDCVPCRDPAEPAAPFVPEGWKLVPVKPNHLMIFAAEKAIREQEFTTTMKLNIDVYCAMIAAAPAPSKEPKP